MAESVGFPSRPNVHAIETVEQKRDPEDGRFDADAPRNGLKFTGNLIVFFDADQGVAIRPKMIDKISANGNYAAEGLQFVENIACFGFRRCRRHARSKIISYKQSIGRREEVCNHASGLKRDTPEGFYKSGRGEAAESRLS
jgi:hypothetical protein